MSEIFDRSKLSWYWYPLTNNNKLPIFVYEIDLTLDQLNSYYNTSGLYTVDNFVIDNFRTYYLGYSTNDTTLYSYWHVESFDDGKISFKSGSASSAHRYYAGKNASNGISVMYGNNIVNINAPYDISNYSDYNQLLVMSIGLFHTQDDEYAFAWTHSSTGDFGTTYKNLSNLISFPGNDKGEAIFFSFNVTFEGTSNTPATSLNSNIAKNLIDGLVEVNPSNPYNGGDKSEQPGDGSFDYSGDGVSIPDLPSISVCDSGFVTLYAPTTTQLNALASFLWSDAFSLDTFKKLFNNPMDCILGLSIIPVNVPTGSAQEITVGNIVSTVSCDVVTQQFITVDCGTLKVSPTKFSGSYLDYAPYVKCYIYLPFIGIQQINIDDVMNGTVHVVYHVDLLTGAMCCYVEVQNRTTGGVKQKDSVLYTYMGQCAESVPLSATSFSNTIGSILTAAASVGGVVATAMSGGAAAPAAASMLAGATTATANAATSLKPNIQHSGSMGGSSGMMSIKYPFMIFDAPHTSIPGKQYQYTGFPSNKIVKLSSLSGFNVIQAINLKVDGANGVEMQEIKSKLESGVII